MSYPTDIYNAQLRQCMAGNSWSGIDDLHNGLLHGHSRVVTVYSLIVNKFNYEHLGSQRGSVKLLP